MGDDGVMVILIKTIPPVMYLSIILKSSTSCPLYLDSVSTGVLFWPKNIALNPRFQYVPESLLPIYREKILPVADIILPNQMEAE